MVASSLHSRSARPLGSLLRMACLLGAIGSLGGGWLSAHADEAIAGETASDTAAPSDSFRPPALPSSAWEPDLEFRPVGINEPAATPVVDPFEYQRQPVVQERPTVLSVADRFDEVAWAAPEEQEPQARHAPQEAPAMPRGLQLLGPSAQKENEEEVEGYEQAAKDWTPKPLDSLTINIRDPEGLKPRDLAADRPHPAPWAAARCWPLLTYHWAATCFAHDPLYFEEINLERYGYGCGNCLQPAASAAHFFGTVPILPYCMASHWPWECDYTLGHYRPGSCVPWRTHCEAPNACGGLSEAGTVVGLVFLIP